MPDSCSSRDASTGRSARSCFPCDLDATLHAALENTLDVPHTAFLHKGIFRGKRLKELNAVRRDFDGGVEVEFLGEPVGLGPIQGGPLAKKTFQHWDRFIMPMVAQVEYRVEAGLVRDLQQRDPRAAVADHDAGLVRVPLVDAGAGRDPGADRRTRRAAWSCARTSRRWRSSRRNIDRFGGERFASTDLDLLGAAIWRMLRQAERAEAAEMKPSQLDDSLVEGATELTFEA